MGHGHETDLHLSKEEQRKRFLARIDDPDKSWKLERADIDEREFWKQYMTAYGKGLSETSTNLPPGMRFRPTTRTTRG